MSPSRLLALSLSLTLAACGDSDEELPPRPTCDLDEIKALTEPCPPPRQSVVTWTRPSETVSDGVVSESQLLGVELDPPWVRKEGQACAMVEFERLPNGREKLRGYDVLSGWGRSPCHGEFCGEEGGFTINYRYQAETEGGGVAAHQVICQSDGDTVLTIITADDEPQQSYMWTADGEGHRRADIPPPRT